jgi:hypothetical protein
VGIGEQELVGPGSLGVEEDAGPPGQSNALDVRPPRVSDEEDEGTPGPWVVELDVDFAGGGFEPHFDPNGRDRIEHEVLRQVAEGGGHGP